MGRRHEEVGTSPAGKYEEPETPEAAAKAVEQTLGLIEGRWKLTILFHLFGGRVLRFSELQRSIPAISQKMLSQQLRQLESDGIITRKIYPEVPPRVEYRLTSWGQSLCPALDSLIRWGTSYPGVEPSKPEPLTNASRSDGADGPLNRSRRG